MSKQQTLLFEKRWKRPCTLYYTIYTIISCKRPSRNRSGTALRLLQSSSSSTSLKGQYHPAPRPSKSKKKAGPSQPSTASSSSSCSLPKAKSSLESLSKSKLSWPVRVQKTLYTMATCCVKCLGPVWYEKNWFFTKKTPAKRVLLKSNQKKKKIWFSKGLKDLENNLFTILFRKRPWTI